MDVRLLGYASDWTIDGIVVLDRPRLADLLREEPVLPVIDAIVTFREDASTTEIGRVDVRVEELRVVVALGPRGAASLRTTTHSRPSRLSIPPYEVVGRLHAPAGRAAGAGGAPTWAAVTDAVVRFTVASHPLRIASDAVLVRLDLAQADDVDEMELDPSP